MGVRQNQYLDSPLVMSGSGWFSAYFYYNGSVNWSTYHMLRIWGPVTGQYIALVPIPEKSFNLTVGGTIFYPGATLNLADYTWHHLAVKYDMTVEDTWDAEVFVNGVSVMSGSRTHHSMDAETSAYFSLGGVTNTFPPDGLLWSDIVIYDDLADPNPYGQFVTRTEVSLDVSDSGSWAPGSNTGTNAQANSLSGSIATTPVVAEANPLTGENVIVSQTSIATQLGITPTSIYGVTGHLFASGSSATNLICAVAESASAGTFTTGAAEIDGENMYAWATAPTTPGVGLTPWVGTDSIYLKAEVSGS